MGERDDKTYQVMLEAQAEKITLLEAEVAWYREQLGLAKKRLYAPSSEKSPTQGVPGQEEMLFNEAEACASPQLPDPETETLPTPAARPLESGSSNWRTCPSRRSRTSFPRRSRSAPSAKVRCTR